MIVCLRIVTALLSHFSRNYYLRIAIHGFWLLQFLDLLVDAYPTKQPIRREQDEPTITTWKVIITY